jgi:transitional endoplasmic reticulum ATPase
MNPSYNWGYKTDQRRALMNIGKKRKGLRHSAGAPLQDAEDGFFRATCGEYMIRHLGRYPHLDSQTLEFLFWIMSEETSRITNLILNVAPADTRRSHEEEICEAQGERDELAEALASILKKAKPSAVRRCRKGLVNLLELCVQGLKSGRKTNIEKNLGLLADVFSINTAELRLVTFLFTLKTSDEAENFLEMHLSCHRFRRRSYLLNMLDLGSSEMAAAVDRLVQINVIEYFRDQFELTDWFQLCCQCPESESFTSKFYRRIPESTLPIGFHMVGQDKIQHVLKLLEKKSDLPAHILLYGPPGTGKTSFAYALASELKTAAYEIVWEDENQSKQRRAALSVCLKMTKSGRGAIIIVDEADNMLNTIGSWFMRGETQDKGWLNRIMEEPGARVIWITNSIDSVEDSVLRRFSFSICFKPFNRRQRVQVWNNVLCNHRASSCLGPAEIERLAAQYSVSAGVVDSAVRTALATAGRSEGNILTPVELALRSHATLQNRGIDVIEKGTLEQGYSLDGLNTNSDIEHLAAQLKRFDETLRSGSGESLNLNLLFYGPPGTGKSALARYLADQIHRGVTCKRISDLQSMYVGEGEKNIRRAFKEAENDEAVLVIDEADSVLFSRERAQRSWEISFTNEFLTRMEHFRGILICTTNRLTDLDEASIRRFNRKIRFDYLTPEGNVVFYKKIIARLIPEPPDEAIRAALRRLSNLAPGDFKNVRDRFSLVDPAILNHTQLVEALEEETKLKDAHSRKHSIGF